jgi:phosphomannomutase
VVKKLITEKTPQAIYDFDGVRLEFDDWWVSVRSSNTEPWLRVVIEADNETLLAEKRAAIETVLAEFVQ